MKSEPEQLSDKDLCDAWLAEMENWEGHWNNFLYGVYDKEDIGQEDAEPGYEKGNWFTGGSKYGKTTLHYPDQYDYYVKDPGVYTITATIDGWYKPAGFRTIRVGDISKKTDNLLKTSGSKKASFGITSKVMAIWQSACRKLAMPGTILMLTE